MADAARVYAEALFEVGRDKGKLDTLQQQLSEFTDAVDGNRELQVFFFSPYLSSTEKQEGIERAITGAEPELINFLELLVDTHRMTEVFRIRREFEITLERPRDINSVGLAQYSSEITAALKGFTEGEEVAE